MVISRIKNSLKRYENLKVNVIFYGKFETLVDDEMVEDIKFFQIESEIFLRATDLSAW